MKSSIEFDKNAALIKLVEGIEENHTRYVYNDNGPDYLECVFCCNNDGWDGTLQHSPDCFYLYVKDVKSKLEASGEM